MTAPDEQEKFLRVLLVKEKETANMVQFREADESAAPVTGRLYIHKKALKRIGNPQLIRVEVREVDR